MKKVINVFLIIGVITTACCTCAIGLAWCLPMKRKYQSLVAAGQPVPVGLKVCTLLFVSTVAGILMLADHT